MKNKLFHLAFFILTTAIFFLSFEIVLSDDIYISSEFGLKCYPKGEEHRNIKNKIEFKGLEKCLDYINKKNELNTQNK